MVVPKKVQLTELDAATTARSAHDCRFDRCVQAPRANPAVSTTASNFVTVCLMTQAEMTAITTNTTTAPMARSFADSRLKAGMPRTLRVR